MKNTKCPYTNMLKRLNILDEQIHEVQAALKMMRQMMRKNMEEEAMVKLAKAPDSEPAGKNPEQVREIYIDTFPKPEPAGEQDDD